MENNGTLAGMNEQDPSHHTHSRGRQAESTDDDSSECASEIELKLASK